MVIMSKTIFIKVPRGDLRNPGIEVILRSKDAGQTWQKRIEEEVFLDGKNFSQVQKAFARAFKDKEDAKSISEMRRTFYDRWDGWSDPFLFTGVTGWIEASSQDIERGRACEMSNTEPSSSEISRF